MAYPTSLWGRGTILPTASSFPDERGHYRLYFNGWRGEKRTYGSYLHIEVTDAGKVYLHHDGTDLIIAQQLMDQGIPKEHIVLAWQAPVKRGDMGFAVG